MRNVALGRLHILGNAAAHADDLDRLVLARAARVRGMIALARAVAQEGVEIGVADAPGVSASISSATSSAFVSGWALASPAVSITTRVETIGI
jgi:hypothetical protein